MQLSLDLEAAVNRLDTHMFNLYLNDSARLLCTPFYKFMNFDVFNSSFYFLLYLRFELVNA